MLLAGISVMPTGAASEGEGTRVLLAGSFTGGWSAAAANDGNSVTVNEDGTYTIEFNASKVGTMIDSTWTLGLKTLDLDIWSYTGVSKEDIGEDDFAQMLEDAGIVFRVDSVKISGEEKLTGESTVILDDDGQNLRINIYNMWTSPQTAIVDGMQKFNGPLEVTFTLALGDPDAGTDPAVTLWGDADGDNDCDIIDVIAVNKDQLGSAMLDAQGAVNADVNRSGTLEFADAVLIMKSLVDLVTLPV